MLKNKQWTAPNAKVYLGCFGIKTSLTSNVIQCAKNDEIPRLPYHWTCTNGELYTFQECHMHLLSGIQNCS